MSIGPFDFSNLPVWFQVTLTVAGVLIAIAAVIGFIRKTWPVVKQFVLTVISLQNLPEFMEKTTKTLASQDKKIAEIHHEVQYNNGSSVKDAIKRVEETSTRLEKALLRRGAHTSTHAPPQAPNQEGMT